MFVVYAGVEGRYIFRWRRYSLYMQVEKVYVEGRYMFRWRRLLYVQEEKVVIYAGGEGICVC